MYEDTGRISDESFKKLLTLLDDVQWSAHVSDVTDHQAADCTEKLRALDIWPDERWTQATLLRIPAGGKLYRHHDDGYGLNIPLESNPDAVSLSYADGIEKAEHLDVGNVYFADRSIEHESVNNGDSDRTHLIVILRGESIEPIETKS